MNDSENLPSKAVTWVPQIFYDMIARIVPGIVILLIIFAILFADERATSIFRIPPVFSISWASSAIIILAIISLSYVLAILFSGVRYLVYKIVFRVFRMKEIDCETGIRDDDGQFWMKYDYIKKEFPQGGERITKLKAEIHMSHVLCAGFLILSIMAWITESSYFWFIYLRYALIFGFIGGIGANCHFICRIKSEVDNYATLLQFSENPCKIPLNQKSSKPKKN